MSRRRLLVVFGLALALRLLFLFELRGSPLFEILLGDAWRFDAWGRQIALGDWFGGEVFYQAPLYPYFVGFWYRIASPDVFPVRVVQALLGALGCTLVAAAGARLLTPTVGFVAGLIMAVYAPAIWMDALIQKTALATFFTALLIYALSVYATARRFRWAALAGVTLGLLVLLRENAFILVFPLGAGFAFGVEDKERRVTGIFIAAMLAVLVPVGLRNARLGGAFLPTASNAGVNFYLGNNRDADGLYMPLAPGRGHPRYEEDDATRLAQDATGKTLTPDEVSLYWFRRAWDDITNDATGWFVLLARKAFLLFHRAEVMDAVAFESYTDASGVLRLLSRVANFGLLFPLALMGFAFTASMQRRLWPITLGILGLAASIILYFVAARFRMGLVPFLVPFAAAGIVGLYNRLVRDRMVPRKALAIGLVGFLWANWPRTGMYGDPRATTSSNIASELLRHGDYERAASFARDAVAREASNANARMNLGMALKGLRQLDEAEDNIQLAMEIEPAFIADAAAELGSIHALQGNLEAALALLKRSIRENPENAQAQHYLGLVLHEKGELDAAVNAYNDAIRLFPDYTAAHHDLALLFAQEGRWPAAVKGYRRALQTDPGFQLSLDRLAWILATHPNEALRDGPEAVRLAQRSIEVGGEEPAQLDILAAALAESGRFDEAIEAIERALRAVSEEDREFFTQRRATYEEREAIRMEP